MPSLKKAELNDIYIEGLLLEIDTDEIKQLNCIFKERYKNGEFEQFKLKLREISFLNDPVLTAATSSFNMSENNIKNDETKVKNNKIENLKSKPTMSSSSSTSSSSTTSNLPLKKKSKFKINKKDKANSQSPSNKITNLGQSSKEKNSFS